MADYQVGQIITVSKPNWQDIAKVLVEKDIDGGGYNSVGIYTVPVVETPGTGEVEFTYDYTFAYQYTVLEADIGELTLRFTPLAPADDQDVFTDGPHTITAVTSASESNNKTPAIDVGVHC